MRGRYAYGTYVTVYVNRWNELIVTFTAYGISQLRQCKVEDVRAGLQYDMPVFNRLRGLQNDAKWNRLVGVNYNTVFVY